MSVRSGRMGAWGVLAALAWTGSAWAQAPAPQIPVTHPRLWLSSEDQREHAAEWLAVQPPSQMPRDDDYAGLAFVAVIGGDLSECAAPVAWLEDFTLPNLGNVSSDHARWYGETAALVFDWCHAAMTPAQRSIVIERWNGYLDILNAKPWGGPGFEANNYYWGYLRNDLNWAIATWHENPRAQEFLSYGLQTRYRDGFIGTYMPRFGIGGVPGEGTQYGRYMLGYPVVPFLSLRDYGMHPYAETGFHVQAMYHIAYSLVPGATPAPPSETGCSGTYRYLMPFNDDEAFFQCFPEVARSTDYGMFLLAMAEVGNGAHAEHARQLFDDLEPSLPFWARYRRPSGPVRSFEASPLDYHAPGAGYIWARTGWEADDAVVMLQLAAPGGVGHRHTDTGSFQVWRAGEWISRETTSYTDMIPGPGGEGTVDGGTAVGHNTLLFEGRSERGWVSGGPREIPAGERRSSNPDGLARVTRLHRNDDFLYAVTDLSLPYRAERSEDPCRYDWPFAERAEREFLFVRGLDALVVFDRALSGDDSLGYESSYCHQVGYSDYTGPRLAAAEVRKTFLAHFLSPVNRVGNVATSIVGGQTVRLHTLLPQAPDDVRVIDERGGDDDSVGQYRLEVDASGQAQSYFLNVLEVADAGDGMLSATLDTATTPWRLSISRAGGPSVVMEIEPGETSRGGAVIVDGRRVPLLERVQGSGVDENGPYWESLDALELDPAAPPATQLRVVDAERGHFDLQATSALAFPDARFLVTGLFAPDSFQLAVASDPSAADPYDNVGANTLRWAEVPATAAGEDPLLHRVHVLLREADDTARLLVGRDLDGDGQAEAGEELCRSEGAQAQCRLDAQSGPTTGRYWLLVQNTGASGLAATLDAYVIGLRASEADNLVATGPGHLTAGTDFRLRVGYDEPSLLSGSERLGYVLAYPRPGDAALPIPLHLVRTGAGFEPYALADGTPRAVVLPPGAAHDRLYFDVPPGASTVTFRTRGDQGSVALYAARVEVTAGPLIAAAPPRDAPGVVVSAVAGADQTLSLSGASLAPGRWYLTPVNTGDTVVDIEVSASIDAAVGVPALRPGSYYNPDRPGHGVFIYPSASQHVLIWYTYLQDGSPTWYYAQAAVPGPDGTWNSPLYRSAWNGNANQLTQVGTLRVIPTAADGFTLAYNVDGQSGAETMSSFLSGCPMGAGGELDVSTHWYDPMRSGYGYSLQVNPNYEFVAAFVYDGWGVPRFLVAERGGPFDAASGSLELEQLRGFSPLGAHSVPSRAVIGSLSRVYGGTTLESMASTAAFIQGLPGSWNEAGAMSPLSGTQGCAP